MCSSRASAYSGSTSSVDMWAAGCVLGEMLLRQPLFAGKAGHLKHLSSLHDP